MKEPCACIEEFLQRRRQQLLAFARSVARMPEDGEDICQEAILRLQKDWLSLDNCQSKDSRSKLLVRRCGIDYYRKQSNKNYTTVFEDLQLSDGGNLEQETVDKELRLENSAKVQSTLCKLRGSDRTIIELYYFRDLTMQQIADELKISVGTAKVRLHRARQKFIDFYERLSRQS